MRKFLVVAAVLSGCADDNSGGRDLSGVADLAVSRDLTGSFICDPVLQNCGAGMKCTYLLDPDNPTALLPSCVQQTGSAGFEEPCDRGPNGDPGDDTCAAGFFCSVIGWGGTLTDPDRHCNKMCNTTADCPADHRCIPRSDFSGDCVRTCNLGSSSCGSGLTCASVQFDIDSTQQNPIVFLTCRGEGSGTGADACEDDTACAAGLLCDTDEGTCTFKLCNDQHACPPGDGGVALDCAPISDNDSLGICQ